MVLPLFLSQLYADLSNDLAIASARAFKVEERNLNVGGQSFF